MSKFKLIYLLVVLFALTVSTIASPDSLPVDIQDVKIEDNADLHPHERIAECHQHPLDPLTPAEITLTASLISKSPLLPFPHFSFNLITLKEPPKSLLLPFFLSNTQPPSSVPRKSFALIVERGTGHAFEVVTDLDTKTVESFTPIPQGLRPPINPEDMLYAEQVLRRDPEVQRRCADAGYPNMSRVNADPWSPGYVLDRQGDKAFQSKRLIQLYLYGKNHEEDNFYAHPFDFIVLVDAVKGVVTGIEELPTHHDFDAANKNGTRVPKEPGNYDFRFRGGKDFLRKDDKPIVVSSPEGRAFEVNGNEIQWQKFKFRLGFNAREGLVLYHINYNDNGTVRPILYRASLSEMWVPYGDPRPPYHRKAVFDEGEYGIGYNTFELKANEDCIGDVQFFGGTLTNSTGGPVDYKNVICVREEDAGILWKHVDYRTGNGVVVRSHRLVLTFVATVGNYEYIFNWAFYQDASIQLQVEMSGILSLNAIAAESATGGHGTIVAPMVNAHYHQHIFSVRLDTEIDGNQNSVYMSEAAPVDGITGSSVNPYGQGFTTKKTSLKTAEQGKTHFSAETGRVWLVSNPNTSHPYTKQPVAWKLMPTNSPGPMRRKDSVYGEKSACFDYDVWVVPYKEDQFFAAGYYLNNSGLPEWVANDPDASVENTDIVLFHNFGMTHIPRVEDYPVMPKETTGFWFKPYNFFIENPSIDVPPQSVLLKMKSE